VIYGLRYVIDFKKMQILKIGGEENEK